MKRATASDFPELRRVFAGYLHEEFVQEHGTPAQALEAFRHDADAGERTRFAQEATRFLEQTRALDFDDVAELVSALGSAWTPASRHDLEVLLNPTGKSE